MRLLIVRHAAAEPAGPDVPDAERALTGKGRRRFRRAARGLARIHPRPDVLLASPRRRAWQTAEILARTWRKVAPVETPALDGGTVADLVLALDPLPLDAHVALVGHEPQLSSLLAHLLGTTAGERLTLGKGGAVLVDVQGRFSEGARLLWVLPPRILRRLG